MDGDLQNLPDDAETLKAMIADMRRSQSSLQAEVAALRAAGVDAQARIDRLQLLLKTIQRATYGRSSEKLDESQYAFTFEEVQTGLGAVDAMLQKLLPRFEPHPINTEFLDIMCSGRAAPGVPKGLQSALVHAAVDILPPVVRERLELGPEYDLHPKGEATVELMAGLAERIPDPASPAAQASERLGLPRSFLWKSPGERARLLKARDAAAFQHA